MAMITKRGRELQERLDHYAETGTTTEMVEICSLLARHARSLHRVFELQCNGHPAMGDPRIPIKQAHQLQERFEAQLEKRGAQLTKRITDLADRLPHIKGVSFGGDPRGCPFVLLTENGRGDAWGTPGIGVN